jgi:glycosyltransferase involved in cell wall biosynthesis
VKRGQGPSLRRGLAVSSGEWIFLIDSDRQFVADEFWNLWNRRQDADLVLGLRRPRRDAFHRVVLSVVVSLVVSLLAGRRIRDPNVPFSLAGLVELLAFRLRIRSQETMIETAPPAA